MQTSLININQNLTMSSVEIAELCEKNHKDVMRDIRNMFEQLEIQSTQFCADYKDSKGRTYPCFNLNKELSLTLVAGYNVKLRHKIILRWQELENKNTLQIPQTYVQALELALQQAKQLEIQAPKVKAFDSLIGSDALFTMNQTAKLLGWGRNKLFAELRERGILLADNLPAQHHVNCGRFVVKDAVVDRGIKSIVVSQTYVTTKGQVWLSDVLNKKSNGELL